MQYKKLRCHYCRSQDIDKEYKICTNYPECRCGFCDVCLKNVFNIELAVLPTSWICLVCSKLCKCQRCFEKFGDELNEEHKDLNVYKKIGKQNSKDDNGKIKPSENGVMEIAENMEKKYKNNTKTKKSFEREKYTKEDLKKNSNGKELLVNVNKSSSKRKKLFSDQKEENSIERKKQKNLKSIKDEKGPNEKLKEDNVVVIPVMRSQQTVPAVVIPLPSMQQYLFTNNSLKDQERNDPLALQQIKVNTFIDNSLMNQPVIIHTQKDSESEKKKEEQTKGKKTMSKVKKEKNKK